MKALIFNQAGEPGNVLSLADLPKPIPGTNATVIYKNLVIKGFGVRGYLQRQSRKQRGEMIRALMGIIAKPSFQLPVVQSFPLERFKEALEADGQSGRNGKVLFKN